MSKHTVQRYMTVNPTVISSHRTLSEAHQTMREHGVRHLPVVDAGKLVGVVSQRDLYLLETLHGVDTTAETVGEAMTPDPYAVPPDASIEEVAREMAQHKYGSAVVVETRRGRRHLHFCRRPARALVSAPSRTAGPAPERPRTPHLRRSTLS